MTQYPVDALGRTTEETSPAGNISYYIYLGRLARPASKLL